MGADRTKERSTGARGPGHIGLTAEHTCAGRNDADPHCPSRRCGHSYADRYDHVDAGNTVTLTHGNQYADIDTHVNLNPYSDGNPFTHSDGDQDRQAFAHPDTDAASYRETDTHTDAVSLCESHTYADAAANRRADAGAHQGQTHTLAQA